jgi:hypothetical protein
MGNLLIDNSASNPDQTIYFAKVVKFYASTNTADIVTIDDNISLDGCMICCSMPAGFSFGERYVPSYDPAPDTNYCMTPANIYCIATFVEDYQQPVILGFLFPKENALSIPDYGLYIFRHESDVMWMIRGDGTVQVYHPSGSMIKIGSDNENEMSNDAIIPTTVDNFYVRKASDYNARKETNLFIKWHAGQEITIDNNGNLIINTPTRIDITTPIMNVDGQVNISTGATGTFSTPDGKVVIVTNGIVTSITPV